MSKLFPASIVGSMPRTDEVRELLASGSSLAPDVYEARMATAIREVVALQERAGLDIVSDGEWRRRSYIGVIAELAHGFELSNHPEDGRPWTIVMDRLAPKAPGFIAREVGFLRSITDRPIKATLPSPALLGERMWDPERSVAYPRREDFVRDCVPVLRRELQLLQESGADIVQIDDPHLCLFVDPEVRARYEDPDLAASSAVDAVNAVVDGISGLRLAVHLCRRAGARARGEAQFRGGYEPILQNLNRLQVHHITLEFTLPEAGDLAVLGKLREDLEIGLGCVSVEPGRIDSVETIVDRVEQALAHVAPERITLNPDCGFAPGSGARVSLDEVYTKLQNEVAAAEVLRERNS